MIVSLNTWTIYTHTIVSVLKVTCPTMLVGTLGKGGNTDE